MEEQAEFGPAALIGRDSLEQLVQALDSRGYAVIGPIKQDEAIVYGRIKGIADLPAGWTDRQGSGHYALERRTDEALFGYAVGPHSWKRFLHPPVETVWSAACDKEGAISFSADAEPSPPLAFLGVRACELRAIEIQDRILREGAASDPNYARRRSEAFVIAVNCGGAGGTCFCASMDAGPRARSGYDLALTELVDSKRHQFLVEIGSAAGAEILAEIPHETASAEACKEANALLARTAASMGRELNTKGMKELLQHNPEHPRWDDVADRCLSCGNCTMVCPTCFCTTYEDTSDLAHGQAERVRKWDSCFTFDFSYIHGGPVRGSTRSRYRQWLTHKLANWIDQFGTSGCVGCGRCVTWCPVGIDLTEEVRAIRETERVPS